MTCVAKWAWGPLESLCLGKSQLLPSACEPSQTLFNALTGIKAWLAPEAKHGVADVVLDQFLHFKTQNYGLTQNKIKNSGLQPCIQLWEKKTQKALINILDG